MNDPPAAEPHDQRPVEGQARRAARSRSSSTRQKSCGSPSTRVTAELGERFEERSILDDRSLHERYWEQIPVTLVDGEPHDFWRVDEDRLRAALRA